MYINITWRSEPNSADGSRGRAGPVHCLYCPIAALSSTKTLLEFSISLIVGTTFVILVLVGAASAVFVHHDNAMVGFRR